jgi:ribonuclease P protein component
MRFRADQHLRRALDFQHIRAKGRRFDCGAFVLWYVARLPERQRTPAETKCEPMVAFAAPAPARLGVVASRAAVGNAIARARAKRRLRELYRGHQSLIPPGTDILLVARGALNGLEYAALEQKFRDACRKLFPPAPPAVPIPPRAD